VVAIEAQWLGWPRPQQAAAQLNALSPAAVGEKAKVADLNKACGQHMQQKAPDEFLHLQRHRGGLTGAGIVLPAERHAAVLQRDQTLVGDGYPMGITRQVLQHLPGSTEWRFGIDHPFGCGQPF